MIGSVVTNSEKKASRIRLASPIHVGFVMHAMQVAGAEVLVKRIIEQLGEQIHPVIYCLDAIGAIGTELQKQGIQVLCLDRNPGIDLSLGRRLSEAVKRNGSEILHAHQYTPFFYSALARLRGANVKILFTEHGRHFPDHVSAKRRWANRLWLQNYADITNACCEFSANALHKKDGFSSVSVIRNGIDIGEFQKRAEEKGTLKRELGLDPDLLYVACIARFHPVKNHELLLSAWQRVKSEVPQARLLLVGDGERRPKMEAMADELEIRSTVDFLGVQNNVSDYLRAVDVFTLTSQSEASSLTLLEAMASECAIVLTDVGGNSEHLLDQVEGLLVPANRPSSLSNAIIELLRRPSERTRLGQAARARVLKDFQLSTVVDQYYELYQQLAKSKCS